MFNGFIFVTSSILMFMIGPIHVPCKWLTVRQKSVDLLEIITFLVISIMPRPSILSTEIN